MTNSFKAFSFITPVWGHGHVNTFLNIGLPSLLSENNLLGIKCREKSVYTIFTSSEDKKILMQSTIFKLLRETMSVDIKIINPKASFPHIIMSNAHREGLTRANAKGHGAVLIPPDCVWADGSIKNLETIVSTRPVTIVHMSGLRLLQETVSPILQTYIKTSGSLAVTSRELVKVGLSHLHPITSSHFFSGVGDLMPANLLWRVGKEGILAHCFHLHPLYIAPHPKNQNFKVTVDDDLALYRQGEHHYVVSDSDEILAFELSSLRHHVKAFYRKNSIESVISWAERGANVMHRQLVTTPIKIHSENISSKLWKSRETQAQKIITKTLTALTDKYYYPVHLGTLQNKLSFFLRKIRKRFSVDEEFLSEKQTCMAQLVENDLNLQLLFITDDGQPLPHFLKFSQTQTMGITPETLSHLKQAVDFNRSKGQADAFDKVILSYHTFQNLRPWQRKFINEQLKVEGELLLIDAPKRLSLKKNYQAIRNLAYGSFFYQYIYNKKKVNIIISLIRETFICLICGDQNIFRRASTATKALCSRLVLFLYNLTCSALRAITTACTSSSTKKMKKFRVSFVGRLSQTLVRNLARLILLFVKISIQLSFWFLKKLFFNPVRFLQEDDKKVLGTIRVFKKKLYREGRKKNAF